MELPKGLERDYLLVPYPDVNNKDASSLTHTHDMPWLMICSINTCRYVCIKHDAPALGLPFGHGRLFIYYDSIPRPGKLLI